MKQRNRTPKQVKAIRFDRDEWRMIIAAAKSENLTTSEFIRTALQKIMGQLAELTRRDK